MLSLFTSRNFHFNEFAKRSEVQNKTTWCRDIYQYFSVEEMGVNITAQFSRVSKHQLLRFKNLTENIGGI